MLDQEQTSDETRTADERSRATDNAADTPEAGPETEAAAGGDSGFEDQDEMAAAMAAAGDGDPSVSAHADEEGAVDQDEIDRIMGYEDSGPATEQIDTSDPYELLTRTPVVQQDALPMLDVLLEQLARNLSDRVRDIVPELSDVEYEGSLSLTFGEWRNRVTFPAMLGRVDVVEWEEQVLAHADSELVFSLVDMMLGGREAPRAKPEGRPYTNIEKALVSEFIERALNELSQAFSEIAPVTFQLSKFEDDPALAQITRDTNPCVWASIHLEMGNRPGKLSLVIPYGSLDPIRDKLVHFGHIGSGGSDRIWRAHFQEAIERSHGTLSVEIERAALPLSEVMTWRPGMLLELDTKVQDPVAVKLNNHIIGSGIMTTQDWNYAVAMTGRGDDDSTARDGTDHVG